MLFRYYCNLLTYAFAGDLPVGKLHMHTQLVHCTYLSVVTIFDYLSILPSQATSQYLYKVNMLVASYAKVVHGPKIYSGVHLLEDCQENKTHQKEPRWVHMHTQSSIYIVIVLILFVLQLLGRNEASGVVWMIMTCLPEWYRQRGEKRTRTWVVAMFVVVVGHQWVHLITIIMVKCTNPS